MNFRRRITLYLSGFLIGGLIVWFGLLKNRPDDALTSWLPTKRIVMQLDTNPLVLTHHAACRMQCRGITEAEIHALIKKGEVNFSKSEVHAVPCPKYAMEGTTQQGHHLRIICAACEKETRIVTAIDLDLKTDTCSCPGDESKH
ncbi:MAG TPA: DUF4258 domain-containing protein [Bacteroidia bacterium]|nr:DUF4258 domain-containing protein [Bacteroidia bacterium]